MSTDDQPPPAHPSGGPRLLRLVAVVLVLFGLAWGVSEHDAVLSSSVGVAPPVDDAPRHSSSEIDPSSSAADSAEPAIAVAVPDGAAAGSVGCGRAHPDVAVGDECTGTPPLRGPPGT